jgi:phosphopantetheine--protein transferase-like protein
MKALGQGWPKVSWQDIEIVRGDGRPELRLTGRAAARAGDGRLAVSLAHDGGIAVAQVILDLP